VGSPARWRWPSVRLACSAGARGIGFYLLNASRVLEFGVFTTVLALLFGVVLCIELLALWLRRQLR
jgi:phosphonate transport system permease protein